MSLDVYLSGPEREKECVCSDCENVHSRTVRESFYQANITHNLTGMANAAGIYKALWRPDECGITLASQIVIPLRCGLTLLRAEPARFEAMNPSNGWGDYRGLVAFVERYLAACEEHPEAVIEVSR
jgi:hypothetical protein